MQEIRVYRANRRPLYIVGFAVTVVVGLLIWAWTVKANVRAREAKAVPVRAAAATTALKSLTKQWGAPAQPDAPSLQPIAQAVPLQAFPVAPRAFPAAQSMNQPAATTQNSDSKEDEERVAMESPMVANRAAVTPPNPGSPLSMPVAGPAPQGGGSPEHDNENYQASKKAFAAGSNPFPIVAMKGAQVTNRVIRAGWDIPAILEQSAVSDLPGDLRARVRENVYDSDTGQNLLLPQNSILIGRYNSDVSYGQARMQVAWDRLQRPGEPTIFLDRMNGLDGDGSAGLRGKVNNHFKRLIGFALLSSAFAAGIQVSQTRNGSAYGYPTAGETAAAAVGQQMGEFGRKMAEKNLQIPPTIEVKAGTRFNVRVNRDIVF